MKSARHLAAVLATTLALPAQEPPEPVLETYDIGDLAPSAIFDEETDDAADAEWRRASLAHLEAFVRTFIRPALGRDEDISTIGNTHLVALCTPKQHEWIRATLAQQRTARADQIDLQIRILDVPRDAFDDHLAALFGDPNPDQPLHAVLPRAAARAGFLKELLGDPRITSTSSPRILAMPLTRTEIVTGETVTYVKDYEVEFVQGRAIANPVVETVVDGFVIETTCGFLGKGNLGIIFDCTKQDLARPIEKFETSIAGDDTPLTIDLPQLTKIRLKQSLIVPDGGLTLFSAPSRDRYAVAMVQAERVPALEYDGAASDASSANPAERRADRSRW